VGSALSPPGYRDVSYWLDSLENDPLTARKSLPGSIDVDVAIVGAGFTGLWTAYYLRQLDARLRIAVLEKEIAGFGASGRNGGWCSALFPASDEKVAKLSSRDAAHALRAAMRASVDEVGAVAAREGIDCDYHKGGTVCLARTPAQLRQAAAAVQRARSWGALDDVLLTAEHARARVSASGIVGGTYTPDCAAIHPAKLVRGLAAVVERSGTAIYEQTAVTAIEPRRAHTSHGVVKADVVVRATEGYTPALRGDRRVVAPVYSLMVATEPLPDAFWSDVGLRDRETFTDFRQLIIYGQRTSDGRLAFGGRGAPYHFGSRVRAEFDRDRRVFQALHRILLELFPQLGDAAITHRWGGPLGVPRDWFASVGLDHATGLGWAGGYVGDGVATSNLAGRTLADLICGRNTDLVSLPWVQHRSRRWEPEPLRWLEINASLAAVRAADAVEGRTGRAAPWSGLVDRLTHG
jgi:glycine/D-amino acid oxidase-like deaminating enzyme